MHLSRDGVPVIIHDATLDRTTNVAGRVGACTAAELAEVDAGFRFQRDGEFPFRGLGIGVPRARRVVSDSPETRTIIELKEPSLALARAVIAVFAPRARSIGSASARFIGGRSKPCASEAPEIATSASEPEARWTLYRSWTGLPPGTRKPYCSFQVPERAGRLRVVTPAFIRQVHAEDATIQVWVIDDPHEIKRLFDWGVDGVISDRPDLAIAARNGMS